MNKEINHNQWKKDIGRVGVLYGGISSEREVSLSSGQAIFNALINNGVSAELIDVTKTFISDIKNYSIDFAFIALHGEGGEDGRIQSVLDWLDIPFLGSGVTASAIAMDKVKSKQIWQSLGLPVIDQYLLNNNYDVDALVKKIGFPMAIKPVVDGSSVGISKVTQVSDIENAYQKAKLCGSQVMAEKWIEGKELTGAIIFNQSMPLVSIDVPDGFYDYKAKYLTNKTSYLCPCGLNESLEKEIQLLMLKASNAIGCKDWSRVDVMLDKKNKPWLLEINTIPGMTPTSLVPKACEAKGISFDMLVLWLLKESWESANE